MPAAGSLNPSANTVARVGPAVAVAVHDPTHPLVLDVVPGEPGPEILLVHGDAVGDGPGGQIVVEPVHMVAGIGHPVAMAERLGDVEHPLLVDGERHRVRQERLGREQLDGQSGGHPERSHRPNRLVGGRGDPRGIGLGRRDGRRPALRIIARTAGEMVVAIARDQPQTRALIRVCLLMESSGSNGRIDAGGLISRARSPGNRRKAAIFRIR